MNVRVKIQRNQIHHWVDVPVDGGGTKEVLQFDMSLPDYPELPTYGMRVDFPVTPSVVLAAITEKLIIVKAQIQRDVTIRQQIENMGYLEFNVEV